MEIRSTEDSWSSRLVIICHICWVPIYFSHTHTRTHIHTRTHTHTHTYTHVHTHIYIYIIYSIINLNATRSFKARLHGRVLLRFFSFWFIRLNGLTYVCIRPSVAKLYKSIVNLLLNHSIACVRRRKIATKIANVNGSLRSSMLCDSQFHCVKVRVATIIFKVYTIPISASPSLEANNIYH